MKRLFTCFRAGKRGQSAVAPSFEEEQRNEAPASPPHPEQRGVYLTRGEQAFGIFRNLPGDDLLMFTYDQLCEATDNFSDESLVGEGSLGTVFRGRLQTGELVAVKKLNPDGEQSRSSEVYTLSRLKHPNIIRLIGYYIEIHNGIVVYEFMSSRSLQFHLHDTSPEKVVLDWDTRMKIAAGVARALDYLHDFPVIFRDLKSSNVLLGDDFHPKLADFQMAKFGADDDLSQGPTFITGDPGYWAPEFASERLITLKADVYSFGILLLEIITGRKALKEEEGLFLVDWLKRRLRGGDIFSIADPELHGQFSKPMYDKAVQVALMCVRKDPGLRPRMKDVVIAMELLSPLRYDPGEGTSSAAGRLPEGPGETSSSGANRPETDVSPQLAELLRRDRWCGVAEAMTWAATKLGGSMSI